MGRGSRVALSVIAGLVALGAHQLVVGPDAAPVHVQTRPPTAEVPGPPPEAAHAGIDVAAAEEATTSSRPTPSTQAPSSSTTRQPVVRKPKPAAPAGQTSSTTASTVVTRPADPNVAPGWVLDASFGAGRVVEAFGSGGDRPVDMAVQPDGKVVVAGFDSDGSTEAGIVVRFQADGTRDRTFGDGGLVRFAGDSEAMALQPDGRILVFGKIGPMVPEWDNSIGGLLRLLPDGRLDSGFGRNGIASVPVHPNGDIALQPDGKIVVVGLKGFTLRPGVGPGTGVTGMGVSRITSAGALDTSFGADGLTRIPMSDPEHFNEAASAVTVLDDDTIAVAGQANPYGTGSSTWDSDTLVARLRPDGQLDTRFNGSGTKRIDFGGSDGGSAILADTAGRFVVAAYLASNVSDRPGALVRLLPTGEPDPTFGTAGQAATFAPPTALTRDPQGRIVAVMRTSLEAHLARYSPDGHPEAGNKPAYVFPSILGAIQPAPIAVAVDGSGRVVFAGSTVNNQRASNIPYDSDWFLACVTPVPR